MATRYEDRAEVSLFTAVARQDATERMAVALHGGVGGLLARIGQWWQRRATVAALARLDDRMLRDIGLTRHQLRAAADGEPVEAVDHGPVIVPAKRPRPDIAPTRSSNDNLRQSRAA